MKRNALAVYVCPSCKATLSLIADHEGRGEVLSGQLQCSGCASTYPIVRGVPRFVAAGSYASSFGRQWNWFRTVQLDSVNGTTKSQEGLRATTGWPDDRYAGAVVLDAGVGAGRYAECVAKKGAEVFGIDLSAAVDAAWQNIGRNDNVHLAQADIFAMPFRTGTFDLAYSIGVLHHTPDPREAFGRIAASVRPGGSLAVYLYDRYGFHFSDLWRKITTRLPNSVMAAITLPAVPAYYVYRMPLIGKILSCLAPISLSSDWRERWLDTFDWYTPKYQWKYLYPEIFRWFLENHFTGIEIFDGPIRMCGVKAS